MACSWVHTYVHSLCWACAVPRVTPTQDSPELVMPSDIQTTPLTFEAFGGLVWRDLGLKVQTWKADSPAILASQCPLCACFFLCKMKTETSSRSWGEVRARQRAYLHSTQDIFCKCYRYYHAGDCSYLALRKDISADQVLLTPEVKNRGPWLTGLTLSGCQKQRLMRVRQPFGLGMARWGPIHWLCGGWEGSTERCPPLLCCGGRDAARMETQVLQQK